MDNKNKNLSIKLFFLLFSSRFLHLLNEGEIETKFSMIMHGNPFQWAGLCEFPKFLVENTL